jgi:hypothetical protein
MNDTNKQLHPLIEALLNDTITSQQHQILQEMLRQDEAMRVQYLNTIDLDSELRRKFDLKSQVVSHRENSFLTGLAATEKDRDDRLSSWQQSTNTVSSLNDSRKVMLLTALFSIAASVFLALWVSAPAKRPAMLEDKSIAAQSSNRDQQVHPIESTRPSVVLSNAVLATFFDRPSPKLGLGLELNAEHVLKSGMVELTFDCGAITIIESPAVFRPISGDKLAVTMGRCSVHAPPGAEGFLIETPFANVVDRGTRFALQVNEFSDAEVHVIEGVAEVSPKETASDSAEALTRLAVHESSAFTGENAKASKIEFRQETYRSQLPDRIISYQATSARDNRVEELESVRVQRSGKIYDFGMEHLIRAELISFNSATLAAYTSDLNIVGPAKLSNPRRDLLSDRSLATGIVNPGGAIAPTRVGSLKDCESAPGFAVHFTEPVVNGPGPDIVFFEIQTAINPAVGDSFHVIPIGVSPTLRPVTIKNYDLNMRSPEALNISQFYEYKMGKPIETLIDLERTECKGRLSGLTFKAVCTGIDLSNMGYSIGDAVQELFFQDANEDSNTVDPVMICGLPQE